jgi:predicted NAD/FAD-binding protein
MSAAYYLSRNYEVHLFEREPRLGGHTHTHIIETSAGARAIDSGFIVHNRETYPNLVRLFEELGVETEPSDMSFSVYSGNGYEWSTRGLRGFFASPNTWFDTRHYGLARDILRFNREARQLLDDPASPTLCQYLSGCGYGEYFTARYLVPMASAVWSTDTARIGEFPAKTLIRFFDNHGLLRIANHPRWRVVKGGSSSYIPKLTEPYRDRIHLNARIRRIIRTPDAVHIETPDATHTFDQVVLACHGDQVLPLLADPTPAEADLFRHFRTSTNRAVLHSDPSHLPARPAARASWNYDISAPDVPGATVTYHMNRLQNLGVPEDYCVTLNPRPGREPMKIHRDLLYRHPLYTQAAVDAQARWSEVSGQNRTHYCGAYWFNGFHEDGLNSALRAARSLGVNC